ncbi:Retrotransposon protein [Seminavis robusta]|uniref:Retrotransposon protein n=1 Tax=Seminavis robusta TaxID=568900 RepID=A0A9N8HAQ5_9STRA|nr:Retrotransposon protein [Seminavis robusta]|eukprot:Sro328_g118620.1 Retrotransposon protein (301) ;mRNA; r:34712-35705
MRTVTSRKVVRRAAIKNRDVITTTRAQGFYKMLYANYWPPNRYDGPQDLLETLMAMEDPSDPGGGGGGDGPRRKPFDAKQDANVYPVLKTNKTFDQWYNVFITTARAQGFYNLFDASYVPPDKDLEYELRRMNDWFYAVFQKIVKTTKGKVVVKDHFHDCDCFHILHELIHDAHNSVEGSIESVDTLNWLTRIKYSTTKGSAVEFIINYDEVLTRYSDSKTSEQDKLSDSIQKLFLQQAFIDIKVLNDISAREQENMCSNGAHMSYSYEKYKEVLTNAATRFDVITSFYPLAGPAEPTWL